MSLAIKTRHYELQHQNRPVHVLGHTVRPHHTKGYILLFDDQGSQSLQRAGVHPWHFERDYSWGIQRVRQGIAAACTILGLL